MEIQPLIDAYLASDSYLSLAESTKKSYEHLIKRLAGIKSLPAFPNPMQIDVAYANQRSHLDAWSSYIRGLPITNCEKNKTRLMLKTIYNALCVGHLVAPIKMDRHTVGEKHPLTTELVERVWKNPKLNRRYATFLRFQFYTGMRPSETFALKWAEVGEFITVVGSKDREQGKASRMIAIGPEIRECLSWCKEHSLGIYVFTGAHGGQLNKDVVCGDMKAIREAVGFEGVLYDARRGIATEMDRAEVDIRKIRDFLGHKDVKTTEGYINKTMEEKAIAVAHPNLGEKQWT